MVHLRALFWYKYCTFFYTERGGGGAGEAKDNLVNYLRQRRLSCGCFDLIVCLSVRLFVRRITYKVMNGFAVNIYHYTHYFGGIIRITIRIRMKDRAEEFCSL